MADQKTKPLMYQPTPEELLNLNRGMDDTPQARFYERARRILTNVNANLRFDLLMGWAVRSESDASIWHPIDTRFEPPTCTCISYQSDPTDGNTAHIFFNHPTKGPGQFLQRRCKHTIAWMGYRYILAQHCSKVNHNLPKHIRTTMQRGLMQPATPTAMHTFALWLPLYYANTPVVTLVSQETWRPHPYGYL